MILDYVALPLILWTGIRALWSDFLAGKIRNRDIVRLVIGAAGFHLLAAVVWGCGGGWRSSTVEVLGLPMLYLHVLTNGLCALGLSFLLWLGGVWAAGDAKLFSALAFALPLGFYENDFLPFFPAFVLFFNTFLGIAIRLVTEFVGRLLVRIIRQRLHRQIGPGLRQLMRLLRQNWFSILRMFLVFCGLFAFIRVIRHLLRSWIDEIVRLDKTMMYVMLFLILYPLMRYLRNRIVFVSALMMLAGYIVWACWGTEDPQHLAILYQIGGLSLLFVAFFGIFIAYSNHFDIHPLRIYQLRPGMILSPRYCESLRTNSNFNNERLGHIGPDGLSAVQVETIQTWYDGNDPEGRAAKAEITTTIPFASGMFIGVLLTLAMRGYLIHL